MPVFLEKKLKQEYGPNSPIPFMVMNKKGYMSGPNETKKGMELQKKHDADQKARKLLAGK